MKFDPMNPIPPVTRTVPEGDGRRPGELAADLGEVQGVAPVVAGPILHVPEEGLGLPGEGQDVSGDVQIHPLLAAPDVVHLADLTRRQDARQGATVILHVQPLPHVQTVAVDGKGIAPERVHDHQRDELLGELVGTVVVAGPGDDDRQAVGAVIGPG